jgi:hypothetical protein
MNDIDTERRIYTLETSIAWAKAFLASVPEGADPKGKAQLAKDEAELAALRAKVAA